MNKTQIAVASLAFGLAVSGALAQPAPDDPRAAFAETDRDGNGQIDREEFHLRIVEIFFFVDLDRDGFVEPEELEEATLVQQDLALTDRNADGRISLHEFVESRFALYREADTDGDGRLSVEETVAIAGRAARER